MCPSFIGILDIQSWWEVPSIAHFCSLFRAAFNLLDFDIEELEEALLTDGTEECASSLLTELIVRLLRGCLGNNDITASNYQMFLRRLFRQKCQETGHSNIFNADIDFQFLPLRRKVQILQALCDFRLAADDVFDLLKNLEAESLRVEPLGWDDNASAYWYFYGTRLYREDYVLKSKGKKRKTRDEFRYRQGEPLQVEERTDRVWQVVCFTEDDWIHLTDKFKESTSRVEKDLFLSLSENFLPEIPRLFQEKERLRRKRLLESMPRRTSSRVQIKNKQKEEDEQKQVVDENFKDDLDEKVQKKEIEQFERENRARQRELKRSQSCSSRSEKSRSPSLDDSSILKHKKKIRHLRHNSDKGSTEDVSQAKPSGRQTNNSLACVTGQILIPDQKDHPNSTRKKVKTSQIFGSMEEEVQTDMYKVLKQLKTHEDAWPFMDPVEEEYAPNYYSVIRRPMDLQRMEDRLDQGFYTDFTKFQSDFNLIVNNCRLYNGQDNEYTEMVDNLEAEFNRLTQRYFDCLSSSDDEIAVEYPFQNPSPKKQKNDKCHKSENENKRKRKRDSSCDEEEEEEELLKDLQKPDKKISKEKVQKEEKKSHRTKLRDFDVDSELSNSSLSDFVKSYLKKKKRKLKNSKKRHKEKHSSKKSKERRKHSKHISKKLKKKRNSPRSSIESNEQSENCSPVHESKESIFTNQLDAPTNAVFYKDKYDEIKERRRGSFKSNIDNAIYTSKSNEKSKSNLLMPDKNKNSKLKETIEKLKAKSEKNNISSALFDDYCRSNTNSHKRVKKNYDDSKDFSKTDQSRKKMDEYEFTDDMDSTSENKSEKTNTKKVNTKKQLSSQVVNSKNESATEALEQAAKVFYKLFDETPSKHSEYNSNSNSPSHMPDEYVPFSLRAEDDFLTNQQDKEKTSFIKSNKKRLVNKELMSKAMSRKKEVQRTIERLQPGKTKGNLISNVQSILKQEDSNSMNSIIKTKEPKNTLLVKPDDTESPKLSLGTVLDSVGFGMEKQHNFTNESSADRASAGKVQVVDTGTMTCDSEDAIASDKTATKPIQEAVDVEPPKKDDESTKPLSLNPSQEKATPNLSAWFKAFGAPKSGTSKKKPDESDQDDSKSNDTTSDGKIANVDNPKNNDPVSIDEVSTTEGGESPIPSLMTGSRIRRTSTGSSISERSSFSQDLDSPRHQPSHTSPVIRSPASPRTDDQKNLYPPINGTVRVGFYQDTASTKSSPEKSCSPRDAPQSPYASYSQHVYAVSSNAAQLANQTSNFNDSSSKSPLPSYGPPYYDTTKTSHTNKAIRSQDDYSVYGTESPIYKPPPSPLPSSYSPVHSTYSQHSQHSPYSHVQPSPQPFGQLPSTNSVSQSYETKHTEKTSIFPVKKRSYTEIQIPDTTTDLRVKSPLSKKISESEQKSSNDKSDLGMLGNIPISYDTKGISMSSPNYFHNNSTSVIMSATSSNVQKLQYPISDCATPLAYDSPKLIDNPLQSLRANKDLNVGLRDSERSIQHSDINQVQHSIIKKQYDYNPMSALKSSSYENPTDMSKHSQSLTLDLKTPSYMGTDLSPSSKSLELDYSTKALDVSNSKTISADLMSVGYQIAENSSAESKLSCMNSKMDACSALNKSHRGYDIYNMVTMANASYPGMLDLNSSQSIAKNIMETNEANQRFVLEKLNPALQYQNLSQDLNKHISDDLINESLKKRSDHLSKQSYGESSSMASNDNYTKNLSLSHQNLSDWKLDCSKNTDPCIYNTYRSMTESNKSSISDNLYNSSNMCETDPISKSQTELRIPMCGVIEIPSHKADHYHTSQAEFSTRTKNVMSLHANKPGDNIFTQLSPNAYKTTNCHSPLSMDPTLRNLSGLPQMIERFKEDRLLSNFQASNASSYEKSIPLAHLYPKNVHNNLHSGNNAANQIFTAPLPMTFNRESLYLSNIQPPLHNLPPIEPPILQELSDKKARGRKKKPTTEVTSASTSGTSHQYNAYSGLKSSKTEQTPLSMKTSNIVPGSAFNFGPPGSVGLPSDLYLEQFRNSSANFNIATNYIAAVQRSNPEAVDKCAKSDHQPSVHAAPNLYSFLAHPQVRPGYPFLGVDPASPLYNQFLQQHQEQLFRSPSSQMMGILPTAYQTALRQPYDTITRPPWL